MIAPTGTIGFMMDCDTTGIEPDLALVKYKKLVGGGVIKIVNNTVPQALIKLGYTPAQVEKIVSHIDSTGTIEGAPDLKPEHLAVFDCSFRPQNGARSIHYMGHVRMMAAVQPFISGAISKTINMPEESTVEDIMDAYTESWKLGLKAVAIYRDNSKRVQPLSSGGGKTEKKAAVAAAAAPVEKVVYRPVRRKLPDERRSITHKFSIGGHEGYITAGMYDDGTPGEIFITMAKEGSTISGLMDAFATAVSFNLQYGVPLKFLVDKFAHLRFEPSGWTGNPQMPYAKSIMDYIFRWLGAKFLGPEYAVTEVGETPNLRPTEPDPQQQLPFAPVIRRRPAVRRMRFHHDAQRKLLQVRQLRRHQRLQLAGEGRPRPRGASSFQWENRTPGPHVGPGVFLLGGWRRPRCAGRNVPMNRDAAGLTARATAPRPLHRGGCRPAQCRSAS